MASPKYQQRMTVPTPRGPFEAVVTMPGPRGFRLSPSFMASLRSAGRPSTKPENWMKLQWAGSQAGMTTAEISCLDTHQLAREVAHRMAQHRRRAA